MAHRDFTKMHGLGNDFVVFDATSEPLRLSSAQVRAIADRHRGVGCDQLLVVEPAVSAGVDFGYRIYNADGSEVSQCGNGARCFARFVREQGLTGSNHIVVETSAGHLALDALPGGQFRVQMGVPVFEPAGVPLRAPARAPHYTAETAQGSVSFQALSLGNPHAVLTVADVDAAPVESVGPALESHPDFPERVNVEFMQIVDKERIRLRVFERGAGETRACGSGACAAAVAGMASQKLGAQVSVELSGGILDVEWQGEGQPVYMSGPAARVFEGRLDINNLTSVV